VDAAAVDGTKRELPAAIVASPCRTRTKKQLMTDQSGQTLAASESPTRMHTRKEMLPEQFSTLAASSSPCRARMGPRGIMSTDQVHANPPPRFAMHIGGSAFYASTRMPPRITLPLNCGIPMQSFGQQKQQPLFATGILNTASAQLSAPGSTCRPSPSGGSGCLVGTTPVAAVIMTAPVMSTRPMGGEPTGGETCVNSILKSMLGDNGNRTGEDVDAQLRAAAPEIYED
jgi:hypothetical protein